ncbi:hypothetical protein NR798_01565 [Archangium gephyra]|uniref:hypothetical protein n=1 Tax=Archangium gephyra TaxID=48 RepID=UPI0035D4D8C3
MGPFKEVLQLGIQLFFLLLLMGAGKLVNRIAGRPLMNGAECFLVLEAILFVGAIFPSAMRNDAFGMGEVIGAFIIPVVVGIHYSRKFANTRQAPSPARP